MYWDQTMSAVPLYRLQQFIGRIRSKTVGNSVLAQRFVHGTLWSFSGAVISRSLTLVGFIVVARMLGKEQFGKLGIIQITVAMFQIFAGFGLGLTATKYVAEFRVANPSRAGRIVALSMLVATGCGTLASVALLLFARPLAIRTLGTPELVPLLQLSAILLFFAALNGYQTGALSGLECFKVMARLNLVVSLVSFLILIVVTHFWGLRGAILGLIVGAALNWAITQKALRVELARAGIALDFRNCAADLKILGQFSVPAILCGAMVVPVNWYCSALLVRSINGYAEMGVFNAMNQWFSALLFLPTVLEQVTLPLMSERLAANDHRQSRRILLASIKVNLLVVGSLVLLGTFASSLIVRLYGRQFHDSAGVLIVVLITAGLYAVQAPVGQLVAAADRMWLAFLMNLGWAVTMLIATEALIYKGAMGLSLARMIAYALHCLWTLAFASHFASRNRNLYARPARALVNNEP
jgi:O-antigen/teichoic acid export membrane protein